MKIVRNNGALLVGVLSLLVLTLHSMYWGLAVPAKSSSLTSKGQPILKPIFPSPSATGRFTVTVKVLR